jgi:hypothetical protein
LNPQFDGGESDCASRLTGHGMANLTMGILNYNAAFRREWFPLPPLGILNP